MSAQTSNMQIVLGRGSTAILYSFCYRKSICIRRRIFIAKGMGDGCANGFANDGLSFLRISHHFTIFVINLNPSLVT